MTLLRRRCYCPAVVRFCVAGWASAGMLLLALVGSTAEAAAASYVAGSGLLMRHPASRAAPRPASAAPCRTICAGFRGGCRRRGLGARQDDSDESGNQLDKGMNLLELAGSRGFGWFLPTQPLLVKTAKATWKFAWERMMSELAPHDSGGNYVRPAYAYASGAEEASHPDASAGSYQLYVGNPCPWCHRAGLAVRVLGLDSKPATKEEEGSGASAAVGVTRLLDDPERATRGGWVFSSKDPDPVFQCADLRELYDRLSPGGSYTGRCTAPLLVDKKNKRIVSNESADIVRFLNRLSLSRPRDEGGRNNPIDLYPEDLAPEIDAANLWVYDLLNNGVYRCGFAASQAAYDRASEDVLRGLERCDGVLSRRPFLAGDRFTEADLRLLPTVLRFDGAYAPLFRAGGAHVRVRSYPHLHSWLVRCWSEVPGVRGSIDVSDACSSYFRQLFPLNPGGIVPSPVTPRDLGLAA